MSVWFARLFLVVSFFYSMQSYASRILFIGNSFTGFAMPALNEFAQASSGDGFAFQFVGGTNLEAHTTREQTLIALQCTRYDYVILQDHSLRVFIDTNSFQYGVQTLSDMARASGAQPMLFQTWARSRNGSFLSYASDQLVISNTHRQAGEDSGAHLIRIGDLWLDLFYTDRPLFNELYQDDGIHQTRPGNYAVAVSVYSVLDPGFLGSAPTHGISLLSRSKINSRSLSLNTIAPAHVNPNTRPLCDTERDSVIRTRCGCTGPYINPAIPVIISTLLD